MEDEAATMRTGEGETTDAWCTGDVGARNLALATDNSRPFATRRTCNAISGRRSCRERVRVSASGARDSCETERCCSCCCCCWCDSRDAGSGGKLDFASVDASEWNEIGYYSASRSLSEISTISKSSLSYDLTYSTLRLKITKRTYKK